MAIGVGMVSHALRAGLTLYCARRTARKSPPWVIKATAANLATYMVRLLRDHRRTAAAGSVQCQPAFVGPRPFKQLFLADTMTRSEPRGRPGGGEETKVIPIVFNNTSDPIGGGFIVSLAHPGGNVTGFLLYEEGIAGKWLFMLKEIAPRLTRVGLVVNPATTPFDYYRR